MSNRHGAYEGPLFSYLERPEPIRSRLWRRANFALTEFSEVRATLRRLSLLRTDHQHGAVGMAHNRVRDATHQRSSYSAEPPTAHHDQVRLELLGQGHNLQSHLPHPEVSPGYGAPGRLHPPGLFPQQLPGHLFDLLVEPAFVAERPWIALQENGHHSDVRHVQLGVGRISQVHGSKGGQFGFFGAVGSEQDPRREGAHRDTLLSRRHPIEGPVLIVSRHWFVARQRGDGTMPFEKAYRGLFTGVRGR